MNTRSCLSIRLFSVIFMLVISAWIPTSVYALGLSPPTIEVDALLRGTTQSRIVTLYRAPDDVGNVYIHVEPDAQQVDFFVLNEQDIVMLDGQNQISYSFGITPGDAANGEYTLKLRFLKTSDPTKFKSGAGVSIVTGVTEQIFVTVGGEEHLAYTLGSVYAQESEEGLDTSIVYSIDNTGNVDWRPQKIVFEFFDEAGVSVGTYEISGEAVQFVKAGQTGQSYKVLVPVDLARGRYKLTATFWNNNEDSAVGTLASDQVFDVYAPGTLAQSGILKGLSVNKPSFAPGEQVKISGIFFNDGQVDTMARMILEVSRDGEIIDQLNTEEFAIVRGEELIFSQLFKATEKGMYEISGHIAYAKRQTPVSKVSFQVEDESKGIIPFGHFLNSVGGLVVLAVVLIAMTIFILRILQRRRKADIISSPPAPPTPPAPPAPPTPPAPPAPPTPPAPITPDLISTSDETHTIIHSA